MMLAFKGDSVLARIAQEEVQWMRRVEEGRHRYIQDEERRIVRVLDALCFLTQSRAEPVKPTITVCSVKNPTDSRKSNPPGRANKPRARTRARLMSRILLQNPCTVWYQYEFSCVYHSITFIEEFWRERRVLAPRLRSGSETP
jgi:hypothetical protein